MTTANTVSATVITATTAAISTSGRRRRASSITNKNDGVEVGTTTTSVVGNVTTPTAASLHATKELLHLIVQMYVLMQQQRGGSLSTIDDNINHNHLGVFKYLYHRCRQLDSFILSQQQQQSAKCKESSTNGSNNFYERMLFMNQCDLDNNNNTFLSSTTINDSGYNVLHEAIYRGDLCRILFVLRSSSSSGCTTTNGSTDRFVKRPMDILYSTTLTTTNGNHLSHSNSNVAMAAAATGTTSTPLQQVLGHMDQEGLTPVALLARLQRTQLSHCRQYLHSIQKRYCDEINLQHYNATVAQQLQSTARNTRSNSFYEELLEVELEEDGQNEFVVLSRALQRQQQQQHGSSNSRFRSNSTSSSSGGTSSSSNAHTSTNVRTDSRNDDTPVMTYGCEIITFGRAHHCTLGVVVNANYNKTSTTTTIGTSSNGDSLQNQQLYQHHRPQRVVIAGLSKNQQSSQQQTHQNTMNTPIAIACSTYHTLTITSSGELYVNGLGKNGRLGTGNELPVATPTRIQITKSPPTSSFTSCTASMQQPIRVIAIAAAENHSLCISNHGYVYAFGSNGFGQLGISNTSSTSNSNNSNGRHIPRRIDDLKHVKCTKVAAGLKHSVAITNIGEIYVWGDNSSGQLGIQSGSTTTDLFTTNKATVVAITASSSNHIHKVTRVDALWNAKPQSKVAIDIAASDQSTLALISPAADNTKGFPVNTIYQWGHGIHVPCKVPFPTLSSVGSGKNEHTIVINPIAISCAKYHNVAITSDGHVYSWGLRSEPLGTHTKKSIKDGTISISSSNSNPTLSRRHRSSSFDNNNKVKSNCTSSSYIYTSNSMSISLSAPQLVTGMLPENGGGKVVAVSASESHTAVVTEDGHLWTWGDTYKQNVLGHEGVKWQPEPKRVPNVHRAVGVAAAKEHTVLLVGTSFPSIPCALTPSNSTFPTLELLAARSISKQVDLFNVIPIMTIAERTQTKFLLRYCKDFVRLNLDGVLNVSQKSAMDNYLNEQLLGASLENSNDTYREEAIHPILPDVILAGCDVRESFTKERLCPVEQWVSSCYELSLCPLVSSMLKRFRKLTTIPSLTPHHGTHENDSKPSMESYMSRNTNLRKSSFSLERYEELTVNMDISTSVLAEAKLVCLTKEARAIRKRLAQISKLESSPESMLQLTNEQKQKVARRYQLEAALKKFDPMIEHVEETLRDLRLTENHERLKCELDEPIIDKKKHEADVMEEQLPDTCLPKQCLRCEVCEVTCPDSLSYELHINGRKHRNRMSQVIVDETKQAAVMILEEQRKQIFREIPKTAPSNKVEEKVGWGKNARSTINPKYTLPPPPHPTAESLVLSVETSRSPISLQNIMAEEASKAGLKKGGLRLSLPPGCPSKLQSPPWETAKKVQQQLSVMPSKPTVLVPLTSKLQRTKTPITPTNATLTSKPSISLGDFIQTPSPKPVPPAVPSTSSPVVVWKTPTKTTAPVAVSFKDIQEQEQEFKLKQDHTFGVPNSNNKWFIEQRERAGSLKDIQGETEKEEQDRLLIEEQIRIEKQIYDEIAAQKKKTESNKTKAAQQQQQRKKQRPRGKGKSNYPKAQAEDSTTKV